MKILTTQTTVLLSVHFRDSIKCVPIGNIVYCESQSNYTLIHTVDNNRILISKTLKTLEFLLKDMGFIRCHRTFVVNIGHIIEYNINIDQSLKLDNAIVIPVSRSGRKKLKELFS